MNMQHSNNDYSRGEKQQGFNFPISALILDMLGMALVVFSGYEIYLRNEKGQGLLTDLISWPYYPWVIMVVGVALMIPFHKQIWKAYRLVKQQQQELAKRNRPDF